MMTTMVSFVPAGTALFSHPLIPEDFGHAALMSMRPINVGGHGGGGFQGSHVPVGGEYADLFKHLIETWDTMRFMREGPFRGPPTRVATCVETGDDGRFLLVTLQN